MDITISLIEEAVRRLQYEPKTRKLAIALTHLETALLWLKSEEK